jgi:tetratricopeptide (TPR) repeat protein
VAFLLVGAVLAMAARTSAAETPAAVARIASAEGTVEVRRGDHGAWTAAREGDPVFVGDLVRVGDIGRAALLLSDGNVLRLDRSSAVRLSAPDAGKRTLLDLLRGVVYFLSNIPRSLTVVTPFVNASVEGTEFLIGVGDGETALTVFSGRVVAANAAGTVALGAGQSALAARGAAPQPVIVVRPRDAVQWALHYPPLVGFEPAAPPAVDGSKWGPAVRASRAAFVRGDVAAALGALAAVPADLPDAGLMTYRAALLLATGRVGEARVALAQALAAAPGFGSALALQAVIAVATNESVEALRLARAAVDADPGAALPLVALSYARQAVFDLRGAEEALERAVALEPSSALAWARLAEIRLSFGERERALAAARTAAGLAADLERTWTVLGFVHLAGLEVKSAREAFTRAARLDQGAPLPRLGLALAAFREGRREAGLRELAVAVALDPSASLLRSYLGKAYFDNGRDAQAGREFDAARVLDPLDPTPWFYDAILKESLNRPVEALGALQRSVELNDNRAVNRSRLLLDEDLAARGSGLGRIYRDLGFEPLALAQGWLSLAIDPADFAAHRLLADTFAAVPRHETTRLSELLQAQLLSPESVTPVQPRLAEGDLAVLEGAGPSEIGASDFTPLFNGDRIALQASGVSGGNDTSGYEALLGGMRGGLSFSAGAFDYRTAGFRDNNDLDQRVADVFLQFRLATGTSVQAEYRNAETEKGDLPLRFNPEDFSPDLRQVSRTETLRFGLHHTASPRSDTLVSLILRREDDGVVFSPAPDDSADSAMDGYLLEVQQIYRAAALSAVAGAGYAAADRTVTFAGSEQPPEEVRHFNAYLYPTLALHREVFATIGLAVDAVEGAIADRTVLSPKLGLVWKPAAGTTLRAAAFRTITRTLLSSQTVEPTGVAGFSQFYDDGEGTDTWRYGVGLDQRLGSSVFAGVEGSRRSLKVPWLGVDEAGTVAWGEDVARVYLCWAAHPWLSVSAEWFYERLERGAEFVGEEMLTDLRTSRVPLSLRIAHPSGLRLGVTASYVSQAGTFGDPAFGEVADGSDTFWVADATIGYRLPRRWGFVSLAVKNLFNEQFRYQDTDPGSPRFAPGRVLSARLTVTF